MKNNCFSKHDNRYTTENYGVHLGGGFGKKLTEPHRDQHRSDSQLFTHGEGNQRKVTSTYVSGYRLKFTPQESTRSRRRCSSATEESAARTHPTAAKDKKHTNVYSIGSTKETFRRYPQRYSLPKDKDGARPSVNTIWWYGSSPGSDPAQARGRDPPSNHSGEQRVKRSETRRCLTSLGRPAQQPNRQILTWQ